MACLLYTSILSMKKHLRSPLALFLSALLLAGALSPALAAPPEGERLDPLVRSVELFRGEEKLTDGAAVSTSDDLVVRYTLEPLTEEMALEGKTLVVSLPSCLQNANTTLNQPVLDIGHVRWNGADERVEFAFADDMGAVSYTHLGFDRSVLEAFGLCAVSFCFFVLWDKGPGLSGRLNSEIWLKKELSIRGPGQINLGDRRDVYKRQLSTMSTKKSKKK